jgi:isopenicillin N synthase-like dioxygenase
MEQQAAAHESKMEELELPTLDLDHESSSRFTEQLAAACRDHGVFRLVNHGVPADLTARLFRLTRDLLDTDPAKKAKLPGYFWGTPALSLRVKDLNWVEGLHLAPDNASADDGGAAYSAFRQAVTAEYVAHMARIARKLFDALAGDLALALDAEQRASYLEERGGTFRAYRYPACDPAAEQQHLGMEPHTDSSVLSILNMDLVGGLQVLVRDGPIISRWCAVRPMEGALVVNLGDMMQAMSGGAYRSVEHRVVAPPPGTERMSLCYFAFPQEDAVIVPSSTGKEERYRAFSYREFREQVQADIKATGAKVGLARFRIPDHPSPAPQ